MVVLALATGANHRDEPGFDPLAPNTHSRYATLELDSDQPGATGRCLLALVYDQDGGVDRVRLACERLALAAWVNDHGNTGATTELRTATETRAVDWLYDQPNGALTAYAGSTFNDLGVRLREAERFAFVLEDPGLGVVTLRGSQDDWETW